MEEGTGSGMAGEAHIRGNIMPLMPI